MRVRRWHWWLAAMVLCGVTLFGRFFTAAIRKTDSASIAFVANGSPSLTHHLVLSADDELPGLTCLTTENETLASLYESFLEWGWIVSLTIATTLLGIGFRPQAPAEPTGASASAQEPRP